MVTGETWRLGRRPALDGLRGVAVLMVVACHAFPGPLNSAGSIGVTVFFTLSGFLITALMLEEHERTGRLDLPAFFKRRARRLLPALFAVVAFYTVLLISAGRSVRGTLLEAVPVLLYVSNWTATGSGPLDHTWSLAVEEQFYLVWPLAVLFAFTRRRPRFTLAALAGISSVYAIAARLVMWHNGVDWNRIYTGSDTHADALLIGCLLAVALHGGRVGRSLPVTVAALLLTLVPLGFVPEGFGRYIVVATVVPLLTAAMLSATVRGPGVPWLEWRPLVGIGRASYGVYLWHFPLFAAFRPTFAAAFGWWGSLAVALLLTAGLTWLSWRFVEQPWMKRRQSRGERSRSTVHGPADLASTSVAA